MSTLRKLASVASLFLLCAAAFAQQKSAAPNWDAWKFLQGKWVGEGSNEQAQGSGYASFEPDLQNKVWVRHNHAEYPGANGSPAQVHDDLMIIYSVRRAARLVPSTATAKDTSFITPRHSRRTANSSYFLATRQQAVLVIV